MRFATLFALLPVMAVFAKNFDVDVGAGGLVYRPSSISGAVSGDTITFKFAGGNHTATQSTFDAPCTKMNSPTAFDSGFKPIGQGAAPTQSVFTLNAQSAASPLWFYCAQTTPANHCRAGMVFAVNPTPDKSFAAFQAAAMGQTPPSGSGSVSSTAPTATSAAPSSTPSGGSGKTIKVAVGANNGLTFTPSIVQASAGDIISFTFMSNNHSVTQSTFANPCVKNGTIDSGFLNVPQGSATAPTYSFMLDAQSASVPLWFYCAQTTPANHCQRGMVFAVNPTADKTFDQFKNNAVNGTNSTNSTSSSPSATSSGFTTINTNVASGTETNTGTAASATSTGNGVPGLGVNGASILTAFGLIVGLVL